MTPNLRSADHLRSLESYVPGLLAAEVASRFGIAEEKVVKLASAENPLGPSTRAIEAINNALERLHLYPDWRAQGLREAIAEYHGLEPSQVVIGAGETELIPLIIRTLSGQDEEVLFPIPTFPIYEQASLIERRRPVALQMDKTLTVDPEKILHAVTGKTKILILTSPNNPLSTIIDRERLTHVLDKISTEVLVLLDEAYVDYSDEGGRVDLLSRYENLVVLRTFSKIYGLAGLRVGYALANELIVELLMKAKPTWNTGSLAAAGALAALQDREHYEKTLAVVQKERARLLERLTAFSNIAVIMQPQANFLCLRILDPSTTSTQLFERLLERGVIVKDCAVSYKGLGNRFLRVDVNTKSRMDVFLEKLEEVLP